MSTHNCKKAIAFTLVPGSVYVRIELSVWRVWSVTCLAVSVVGDRRLLSAVESHSNVKVVSRSVSLHYLQRSLGPFSSLLMCT